MSVILRSWGNGVQLDPVRKVESPRSIGVITLGTLISFIPTIHHVHHQNPRSSGIAVASYVVDFTNKISDL